MVTVSVAVPDAPPASDSNEGEIVRLQPALSVVLREYVSGTAPSFLTVTVNVTLFSGPYPRIVDPEEGT